MMNAQQFTAPTFQTAGFSIAAYRRTPEQKAAVAAKFAARVAARRDERIQQTMRFGRDVFFTFINGHYVEGDAAEVIAALARYDRRDEPVTVRMSAKIDADYAGRDVFAELPTGRIVRTTRAVACAMLEDAYVRVHQVTDRATVTAFNALIRQLQEVTA